jgi:hypothetical protein
MIDPYYEKAGVVTTIPAWKSGTKKITLPDGFKLVRVRWYADPSTGERRKTFEIEPVSGPETACKT